VFDTRVIEPVGRLVLSLRRIPFSDSTFPSGVRSSEVPAAGQDEVVVGVIRVRISLSVTSAPASFNRFRYERRGSMEYP
jgi:hypothetical protein